MFANSIHVEWIFANFVHIWNFFENRKMFIWTRRIQFWQPEFFLTKLWKFCAPSPRIIRKLHFFKKNTFLQNVPMGRDCSFNNPAENFSTVFLDLRRFFSEALVKKIACQKVSTKILKIPPSNFESKHRVKFFWQKNVPAENLPLGTYKVVLIFDNVAELFWLLFKKNLKISESVNVAFLL